MATWPNRVAMIREPHDRIESAWSMWWRNKHPGVIATDFASCVVDVCEGRFNDMHVGRVFHLPPLIGCSCVEVQGRDLNASSLAKQRKGLRDWRTSAYGTKQTLMPTMSMSAFGGKADFLIYAVVSATDPKRTVDLAAAYEAPTAKYV